MTMTTSTEQMTVMIHHIQTPNKKTQNFHATNVMAKNTFSMMTHKLFEATKTTMAILTTVMMQKTTVTMKNKKETQWKMAIAIHSQWWKMQKAHQMKKKTTMKMENQMEENLNNETK